MNTTNTNRTLTKVGETLARNDFSPDYIREMQARLCGGFTPEELVDTPNVLAQVADWIQEDIRVVPPVRDKDAPHVIAFVGPAGSGKTTVIAKLAAELKSMQWGKTHLLLAIGNYIKVNGRNVPKICHTTAENFQNNALAALKSNTVETFVNKCSCCDVFLMDDIQCLSGKMGVQETILKIVAGLKKHDAQLVFTSDCPLKEMSGLDERLRILIRSGASVEIAPPQFETRKAILQKNLELLGKSLPEEVISYIASNVQSNVRDLEGCLHKVLGYSKVSGHRLEEGRGACGFVPAGCRAVLFSSCLVPPRCGG